MNTASALLIDVLSLWLQPFLEAEAVFLVAVLITAWLSGLPPALLAWVAV